MPIIEIKRKGRKGYKWGVGGKEYFGGGARTKARKQGQAISISKARRKGYKISFRGSKKRRGGTRRL